MAYLYRIVTISMWYMMGIMLACFSWIVRKVNHWLCICTWAFPIELFSLIVHKSCFLGVNIFCNWLYCQEEKTVTVLFVVMHWDQVLLSVPFHLGSICTRVVPVAFRICLPTPLGGTPVLHTVKFFFFFFSAKTCRRWQWCTRDIPQVCY